MMTPPAARFAVLLGLVVCNIANAEDDRARRDFFEAKIRPVLAAQCQSCHGPDKAQGGLRVDWREPFRKGGRSGPAFEPNQPDDSLLLRALDHSEPGVEMPKKAPKLPDHVVKDFREWIADGAFDPRDKPPTKEESALIEWHARLADRKGWWSLQPVTNTKVPEPATKTWPKNDVDRFILSKLDANGLSPASPADRPTLARRLSFVLTGLPPSSETLKAFLNDPDSTDKAYERLVDKLLASPHFGERWARHWMDVVRFGDTYGYEWDVPAKGAWRYRDYLIRGYNQDVPFDQLAREQIAGDRLPNPRINASDQINESLIGPMFYQLGEKRHGDSAEFDGIHQEMVHNKIDALTKAFQGVTVGCARCHDHKFDAVSQPDYYALAGVLISPRWATQTIDTPERNAKPIADLRRIKREIRSAVSEIWLAESNRWPMPGPAWTEALTKAGADPAWENPLKAWIEIRKADQAKKDVTTAWKSLAWRYRAEARERIDFNATTFRVIADFRQGKPEGWSIDGVGLRDGPVRSGDFTVSLEGPKAIGSILPAGLFTHAISPRLNGAVRSPLVRTFAEPWISLETCGGDFAAERTVVDNAFLTERQTYLARRDPAWSGYPPFPELSGRNVYREVATKTSNPNFPPRVGLGGACTDAQIADPRSWFGITRAVMSKTQATPRDELSRFRDLFDASPPNSIDDVARIYAEWLRESLVRWSRDEATDDDSVLINWMLDQKLLPNDASAGRVQSLIAEYRNVEKTLLDPQTVHGMVELDPGRDYRLNIRGEYDQLGPSVPRGYLGVLKGSDSPASTHDSLSGRLELADEIASVANPLTARVYVNRVWQWTFGTGLVSTPDDFGKLGNPPSHPELLDHLATHFVTHNWSTKDLVRMLVTSATFRQSGETSAKGLESDPSDRLLHHFPLRRLEAEEVRDAILAASGRLDPRMFGPPVDPHRPNEDPQKRLFSGPIDGLGRRSIYTKLTIMEPPRFLATFNQPPPKIPSGRRDVTSNPAQALTLLNDPFVLGQAKFWAERIVKSYPPDTDERIRFMFVEALGREPGNDELDRWKGLVNDLGPDPNSLATWADVAHSFFNIKEFIYVR